MENFINEENYKGYKKYYDCMVHKVFHNDKEDTKFYIFLLVLFLILTIAGAIWVTREGSQVIDILRVPLIETLVYITVPKIVFDIRLKKLIKEEYPYVDTKINIKELEKNIKEYQREKCGSVIDKVKLKADHLENYSDKVKEKNTEEMLEFLNKEKEFWESVQKEEIVEDKVYGKNMLD